MNPRSRDPRLPDGRPRPVPSESSMRRGLEPHTRLQVICPRCLAVGARRKRFCTAVELQTGSVCGAEMRELVTPVRADEFSRMPEEERMDLRTRRIG
jgi:hypothetical protein